MKRLREIRGCWEGVMKEWAIHKFKPDKQTYRWASVFLEVLMELKSSLWGYGWCCPSIWGSENGLNDSTMMLATFFLCNAHFWTCSWYTCWGLPCCHWTCPPAQSEWLGGPKSTKESGLWLQKEFVSSEPCTTRLLTQRSLMWPVPLIWNFHFVLQPLSLPLLIFLCKMFCYWFCRSLSQK